MENIDILSKIKEVETPPFLYSKIMNKLSNKDTVPLNWKWYFSVAAIILLFINTSVLFIKSDNKTSDVSSLITELGMTSSNNLYYE